MPAVSLSVEPAIVTAIANDVGIEVVFLRQLIAHARPEDVADRRSPPAAARATSWPPWSRRGSGSCSRSRCWATTAARSGDRGWPTSTSWSARDYIPRIQEVQASIYHVIRESLETLRHA